MISPPPARDHESSLLTRRAVLKGAVGFQLALYLGGLDRLTATIVNASLHGDLPDALPGGSPGDAPGQAPAGEPVALSAWIKIGADEQVTITITRSEMGQGVRTSLAMIVADELDADWERVRVTQAPAGGPNGGQTTVGSQSVQSLWRAPSPLRTAGATARAMLITAAAQAWQVPAADCRTEPGAVVHAASGRRLSYGALAAAAARLPVPPASQVRLKDPGEFRIIGQPTRRVDNLDVVTGRAIYGIDVRQPGMLFAVVARCPVFGGRVARFDDGAAKAVPGVRHVVQIQSGIAVVADTTWAALRGRDALDITWDEGPNAGMDSAQIRQGLVGAIATFPDLPGDAATVVAADYEVPYLAHATMEPMNCAVQVGDRGAEVWAPTQSPDGVQRSVATALGQGQGGATTVNVTLMGGGFGRRAGSDYASEAAQIAREVRAPVQLTWTREDDLRHDTYRPASRHALRGALDAGGRIVAYQHHAAMAGGGGNPNQARPPYNLPAPSLNVAAPRFAVPTGAWRSVAMSQIVFANESFVDELAAAAGRDPYAFRLGLASSARLRGVLELAATRAGWDSPPPAGRGRGIACCSGFGSHIAVVAEVSVAADGRVRVHRVVAGVDCGLAINPLGVEAQIQGAIVDGLSTALKAEITIEGGHVKQSGFWDYEWFRMPDMPVIEVHLVASQDNPGGVGELGYPATPPAVANAIFAATGQRARRLPIRLGTPGPTETPTAIPPTSPPPTEPPPATPTPRPPDTARHRVYVPSVEKS